MIRLLAFRNIVHRPWRSALLFFGYGTGVGVMIVLLSVGEALLNQARDEKLVGGGSITVLPQGIDVEVMKTGGVGGLYFSIDHGRFIYDQLLASPRLAGWIAAAAPQIDSRVVYLRTAGGEEHVVRASGEIPAQAGKVGSPLSLASGTWLNDEGDRRWVDPTLEELRHEIDHFHLPPDGIANRESWAEWHYFNVLSSDRKRWAFISYIVAGDVSGDKWGGNLAITLREEGGGGRSRKFSRYFRREQVRFSTTHAHLQLGMSTVQVRPDGKYALRAQAREEDGTAVVDVDLVVNPTPRAYFPGASLGSGDLVSGYTVPGLRADASGTICVDSVCERFDAAQSYHDHNWGIWKDVSWDWGASRAGAYTILYGRVLGPEQRGRETPLFVYLVDSLGFRAVMRPRRIDYMDGREIFVDGVRIRVPSRAVFADVRGSDTLRVELEIEDAIGTDMRRQGAGPSPFANREASAERGDPGRDAETDKPYFIQMKGIARITGRIGGSRVDGTGSGFFETFR
ncbi:MAG: ABC transporter permease [Gemmatimonadaceae bacterium]|nr:ABC transporter permease [Gemmatimonadaceae bacterium]